MSCRHPWLEHLECCDPSAEALPDAFLLVEIAAMHEAVSKLGIEANKAAALLHVCTPTVHLPALQQ